MKPRVFVFDFDGTIADSAQASIDIFEQLSKKFNLGLEGKDVFDEYREKGARKLINDLEIPLRKIPFLMKRYREESARVVKDLKPISNVSNALKELKKEDSNLGILTSNSKKNVKEFLEKNDLPSFDFICSEGSLFGKDKVMRKMLKKQGFDSEQAVYVGDETRDIDAAKKAEITIIAVAWGFNTSEALKKRNPDFLAYKPKDLVEIANRL